jgi:hypothetical protein
MAKLEFTKEKGDDGEMKNSKIAVVMIAKDGEKVPKCNFQMLNAGK